MSLSGICDIVVAQWLSHVQLFTTPWITTCWLFCSPLFPGVCSDSWSKSQWCFLTISFSAAPFSFCLQSFPASWSFPLSHLFTSGGQTTGDSVFSSILPMNIQDWFPLGITGLISLQSKELSRVFSSTTIWKRHFLAVSLIYLASTYNYWKNHSFDYTAFCWQSDVSDL